jgi:hypothetical protein
MADRRTILLHDDGSHETVQFKDLKKGDTFVLLEPDGSIMDGVDGFVHLAVGDAEPTDFGGVWGIASEPID